MIRTIIALIWSTLCCVIALLATLLSKRLVRWVLIRIGSEMWSRNMIRIAGNKDIQISFSTPQSSFKNWPEKAIFIANHSSQLDINASASAIPRPIVYLAKDSIRRVPILGLLNERVGTVFVDRSNSMTARASVKRLHDTLNKGISVIVYPEGTRSLTGELGRFKKGAFYLAAEAGIPIIPLHIHGTRKALPKNSLRFLKNPIHVRFGDPIFPQGVKSEQINSFVEAGFESIKEMRHWHLHNIVTPD